MISQLLRHFFPRIFFASSCTSWSSHTEGKVKGGLPVSASTRVKQPPAFFLIRLQRAVHFVNFCAQCHNRPIALCSVPMTEKRPSCWKRTNELIISDARVSFTVTRRDSRTSHDTHVTRHMSHVIRRTSHVARHTPACHT
jgi:hypothetical protein